MFNRTPRRRRHRITIHQVIWAYLVVVLATLLLVVVTYGYTARPGWVGIAGLTLWDWFNLVGVFVPTLIVLLMTTVRGQAKWVGLVFMLVLAAVLLGVIYYGYITRAGWVGVAHQTLRDWFELLYPALAIALVAWLFAQLVARGQDEGQVSPMVIAVAAVGIVGGLVLISYSLGSAFRKGSLDIPPALLTAGAGALTAFLSNYILQQLRDRAQREREEALERSRTQEATLDKYAEKMSDLVLNGGLQDQPRNLAACHVAKALTTAILMRLDSKHKRRVLKLVHEMDLITRGEKTILKLNNAALDHTDLRELSLRNVDLSSVDLQVTNLIGADLSDSDLSEADLRGADLRRADLSGIYLIRANLLPYDEGNPDRWSRHFLERNLNLSEENPLPPEQLRRTDLRQAVLSNGQLRDAWLGGADLRDADLMGADLNNADLSGAELNRAKVTEDQLNECLSLEGATMPNGQKYEEWLKSKGSREDG